MCKCAFISKSTGRRISPAVIHIYSATSLALVMILVHIAPSILAAVVKDTLAVLAMGMGAGPGFIGHWIEGERNSSGEELVKRDVQPCRAGFWGHQCQESARSLKKLVWFPHIASMSDLIAENRSQFA
jgi:hypothetical protein